jgi:uncharacterized protein YdeI (BOF family)
MKNLILAAAAMLALGSGVALADDGGNNNAQPPIAPQSTQQWTQNNSGIYVANSPRHQVWVYSAMQSPAYDQGGEQ